MFFPLNGRVLKNRVRILLVVGLPLIGLGFSRNLKSPSSKSDISCSDVVSLFRWGALHHGFGRPNFKSPVFSKRVAQLFAEKTDTERLLFLKSDVENLINASEKAWEAVVEKADCSYYQKWSQEKNQRARIRFEEAINLWMTTHSFFSKTFLKDTTQEYTSFAGSIAELSKRQEAFLNQAVIESHPSILESYRDKTKLFFWQKFRETNSEIGALPNTLLAKAALAALDPYSTYFSKDEFSDFYDDLLGSASGVGLEVQKTLRGLGVTGVIQDSPAAKQGIQVGDEIIAINGNRLEPLDFKSSVSFLKGEQGTQVNLTLFRKNTGIKTLSLERTSDIFKDHRVSSQWLVSEGKKRIAVISIPSFYGRGGLGEKEELNSSSSEDFQKHLVKIIESPEKADAIVIDLRGNPGGYLEEAVAVAGYFLGQKPVVGVKDSDQLRVLKSELNSEPLYTGPLLVAIDEDTASAGEVLASALKDYQRAIIVGAATTFGKGTVQKIFQASDPFLGLDLTEKTGTVKLTTSVFFSPLGHSPANGGVRSHVVLTKKASKKTPSSVNSNLKVVEEKPLLNFDELEKIKRDEENLKVRLARVDMKEKMGSVTDTQILKLSDQVLGLEESVELTELN